MKSCFILLLALSAAAVVHARVFQEDGMTRSLQQFSASAYCPAGCDKANGGCIQDATMAGLRCQKCLGTLVINKINGNCSCPAGKYAVTPNNCVDCDKSYYCLGGDYVAVGSPNRTMCPVNMTTVGKRSTSNRACVQLPGFYYTFDVNGDPAAVECPADSFGAGFKKQRACVPCPTGFTTNGKTGRTRPTDCLVPAGYYLKAPGQVAPCPQGEYKELSGPNGNCTKCAFGVTTPGEGSTTVDACTIVMPGYYARAMNGSIVTWTDICPQGWYCPGNVQPVTPFNLTNPVDDGLSIKKCDFGQWTIDVGSQSAEQCLVPPGYYNNGTDTLKCDGGVAGTTGSYRADWKPAAQATSCTSCGIGVSSAQTEQIKVYNFTDATKSWMESVTASADDCYILPGQGLYYTSTTATWRARNCDSNNYGVPNITYGLTPAPCKDCPSGMVAIHNSTYPTSNSFFTNNTGTGTYGFTSVKACVTQDGYGYNGRVAQQCDKGTYNNKDNYNDCTRCDYGLTTADVGAGVTAGDCGMAPGFGIVDGVRRECAIGTYNNLTYQASTNAPCTACPIGTTTQATGSDRADQCNLCVPGYGGIDCNATCGGTGTFSGTYGPPGRSPTDPDNRECVQCSTMTTGFSFSWQFTNDVVPVPPISKDNASSSVDCLSKYAQIYDGAWYIPSTPNATNTTTNIANFQACLDQCDLQPSTDPCQYVTYNYETTTCVVRYSVNQIYVGAPVIGFKAVPSGDVATNAWDMRKKLKEKAALTDDPTLKAMASASGQYTFYQDPNALEIGRVDETNTAVNLQYVPAGVNSFTRWQDCLNACDDDPACAAFIIELKVIVSLRPATCRLIKGNREVGEFKRSMTRADIGRLTDISNNLK